MKEYVPRIIDSLLDLKLSAKGAVVIEGAKWCGKTTSAKQRAKSVILMNEPARRTYYDEVMQIDPGILLKGDVPRLIDEWQLYPGLWDAVRFAVDERAEFSQFILTGSVTPTKKRKSNAYRHSGAGRFGKIYLRTMSLFESGDSSGDISLKDICEGKEISKATGEVDLKKLASLIIRGGWPGNLGYSSADSMKVVSEYIDLIINDDLYRLDGINRDKHKVKLLLKSLARNESTTVTNSTIKKDIKDIDNEDIDIDTVSSYLNALDKLFLLDNDEPFSVNIRSSVRVKQAEKRHFADPSLACAVLNLTEEKMINDLNTFGFMFEAMVERDLKIYADSFDAKCYHYQDYLNREIDSVIELNDGNWCAFEIKLGVKEIDNAAKNLINIKESIEKDGGKAPSVLCVICGMSNAAYQRPDGVYVVPITALKN